jgi:hypothetical protein
MGYVCPVMKKMAKMKEKQDEIKKIADVSRAITK